MTFAAYGRFTEAGIRRIAREKTAKIEAERQQLPAPAPETVVVPFVPPGRAIINRLAAENGLTFQDIVGLSRAKHIVKVRFDAIAAVYSETGMSMGRICKMFNRDHTSIHHALRSRGLR